MLTFACPSCARELKVRDELAGRRARCPHCKAALRVPGDAPAGAAEAGTLAPNVDAAPPVGPSGDEWATLPPKPLRGGSRSAAPPAVPREGPSTVPDPAMTDFLAPPQGPGELGRLGHYRVLRVLGAGGMGVVFHAEDAVLQRAVALKAMLPALASSGTNRERFLREARAAAAVEHENVVVIHHVGEERGVPFLAMPFLKGESLEQRLRREGRLPAAEVVRIGREAALGLAAAHKSGLVHRDVKPGNIWLEEGTGRVKILDFGIARSTSGDTQLTQQGAIIGTPAYMAPEQGAGKAVDGRTDLFSLGVVLYRAATGQMPFRGRDTVSTLMAVATEHPRAPEKVCPAVPAALSRLILQLLAKDPDDRPATGSEVAGRLGAIEAGLSGGSHTRTEAGSPGADGPAPAPRAAADEDKTGGLTRPGPRRPRRKAPAGRGGSSGLVVAAVVGGAVFLLLALVTGVGVLAYRLSQKGTPGGEPLAAGPGADRPAEAPAREPARPEQPAAGRPAVPDIPPGPAPVVPPPNPPAPPVRPPQPPPPGFGIRAPEDVPPPDNPTAPPKQGSRPNAAEWAVNKRAAQILVGMGATLHLDHEYRHSFRDLRPGEQVGERPAWVQWVDLSLTRTRDDDFRPLAGMLLRGLGELNLRGCDGITGEMFQHLRAPNLRRVLLTKTGFNDAGLERLMPLKELEFLDLRQTRVTPAALRRFQESHRKCVVQFGAPAVRRPPPPARPGNAPVEGPAELPAEGDAPPPADAAATRRAADAVMGLGGEVTVHQIYRRGSRLFKVDHLPQEPYWLVSINLAYTPARDDDLRALDGLNLRALSDVNVSACDSITGEGFRYLRGAPNLKEVHAAKTDFNDAGLEQLAQFRRLEKVDLRGTKVTPAGVKRFKDAVRGCNVLTD
jgi:hypothetical protein